jgi:hypothetical protein
MYAVLGNQKRNVKLIVGKVKRTMNVCTTLDKYLTVIVMVVKVKWRLVNLVKKRNKMRRRYFLDNVINIGYLLLNSGRY